MFHHPVTHQEAYSTLKERNFGEMATYRGMNRVGEAKKDGEECYFPRPVGKQREYFLKPGY